MQNQSQLAFGLWGLIFESSSSMQKAYPKPSALSLADVICLEEIHIAIDEAARFAIGGQLFTLAQHGRATYVKFDIADAHSISSSDFCDVIGLDVEEYQVANVYKPPSANWQNQILPILHHPSIYTGDFNSHKQDWGYDDSSKDGEELANRACKNDISLIYDAKQRGTFHSARWKRTTHQICAGLPLQMQVSSTVLGNFPHSQHQPMLIHVGLQLTVIHSSNKLRWNFWKANWSLYSRPQYSNYPGPIYSR